MKIYILTNKETARTVQGYGNYDTALINLHKHNQHTQSYVLNEVDVADVDNANLGYDLLFVDRESSAIDEIVIKDENGHLVCTLSTDREYSREHIDPRDNTEYLTISRVYLYGTNINELNFSEDLKRDITNTVEDLTEIQ
jgi:hypothetical protein